MPSSSAHPRSGFLGSITRPIIAALLIALPLLIAGIYAVVSGNDVSPASTSASSQSTTDTGGSTTTDSSSTDASGTGTAASADPLAKSRSSLNSAALPLQLLSSGLTQLTDAAPQLVDGVNVLSGGLGQARTGSIQLADGAGQLNAGFGTLQGGIAQLGDGAQQLSGGVDTLTTPLLAIGAQQADVTASIADVANRIEKFNSPGAIDAANRLRELIGTLDTQGIGPSTVSQINQLRDGAKLLAYQLSDSGSDFNSGVAQLAGGAAQLDTGTGQLVDGIVQLDDGGKQLKAGTDQIGAAVTPIGGVVSSLQTNVKSATDALPTAQVSKAGFAQGAGGSSSTTTSTTTNEDGTTTTTVLGSGGGSISNYLLAGLVAVGAVAGVSLMRRLVRGGALAPVIAVITLTAAASVVLFFAYPNLGFAAFIGGIAFLALSSAAFVAAAGAVQLAFGRAVGQSVNLVLLLVQLVIVGSAFVGSPDSSVLGKAAAFTPLGWLGAGLDRIAGDSLGSTGVLAIIVMLAVLGLSGLVYAVVGRSGDEGRAQYA